MDDVVLDVMEGHFAVAWGTLIPKTAGLTTSAHGSTTPMEGQKILIVGKHLMRLKTIISWVFRLDVVVGTVTSLPKRQPQYQTANNVLIRTLLPRMCLAPLSEVFLCHEERFQPIAPISATS